MKTSKTIDMTQGPILKLIALFALPICIGNVLQQLYTTVDTLVIGNFCSSTSLAAVGTSTQPVEIFLCIFLGIGTGVSILVSQSVGSGNYAYVKRLVQTATAFLYLVSVPLTILGLVLGPFILKFMQVPDDTWDLAMSYLRITLLGTLGNMGYNMNAGILRGVGDSRSSLFFLLASCIINIVLDLVFVAVFGMDVAGAALATIIAQYCSWLFSILYIRKKYPELEFKIIPRTIDKDALSQIIRVGLPLGINNSIYSIGHVLQQSLINAQGSNYIAACSVAAKITGIAGIAISSFSSAATTFAGQNLGAKNYKRLKCGGTRIPFLSGLITLTFALTITFFCRPILMLFTRDEAVLDLAVLYTRIVLPSNAMYAVLNCIIAFVNGMGYVKYPTIVNVLMLWAVRIPSAWLINRYGNGYYVCACFPISFFFGMCAMCAFFFTNRWKDICRKAAEQTNA